MATLQMLQAARALIGHAYLIILSHCDGAKEGGWRVPFSTADKLVENHLNWKQHVVGQKVSILLLQHRH